MATETTIAIDDRDTRIVYHCPVTTETVQGSYFRKTWTAPQSLSCGLQYGWFTVKFNGTQLRIFATDSQINDKFAVRIDNGSFVGQHGYGYYESPVLADGPHTITYSSGNLSLFPAFDYLTITAGRSTQLFGESIIVDDSQMANFSGKWDTIPRRQSTLLSRPLNIHRNTTHWTNTTGDSFSLDFEGDSVAVYGIVPDTNTAAGNSTASCIVDGVPAANASFVQLPRGSIQVQPMVQFCRLDVPAGKHILTFNATHIVPTHSFGIDFVVFNSTEHVDTVSPLAGGAAAIPAQTHNASTKSHNTRVIVGAAVGGLAALAIILLALICCVRRRRRTRKGSSKWATAQAGL